MLNQHLTSRIILKEYIMKQFVGLRAKTYSYLIDYSSEYEKGKKHKKLCQKNKT